MGLNAIMVAVDYTDLLSLTLPYNRHHFDKVCIVTDLRDDKRLFELAGEYDCRLYTTDAFTRQGAVFNKWLALEEGLDAMGREGWIAILDADVLWPKTVSVAELDGRVLRIEVAGGRTTYVRPGQLCSPLRRMHEQPTEVIPPESEWVCYPIHRNVGEWAGYTQIFHGSDPMLGKPPWHNTRYATAGTADSFFQQRWPTKRKIRPDFNVLHLGQAGKNWAGRATNYLDGSKPVRADECTQRMAKLWADRRGKVGPDKFAGEKIK